MDDWQTGKSLLEANYYMLHHEISCDVIFEVGDNKETILAHKYVLMSRSPMFHRVLKDHVFNPEVTVNVPDMTVETFKDTLTYIYTDNIDMRADNVTLILYAARRFQLKALTKICFTFLENWMSTSNVCKIMEQAHQYDETKLYDKCLHFFFAHSTECLRSHAFSDLCGECLTDILRSDNLKADEEHIFECTIDWSTAECRRKKLSPTDENRRTVLGPILYFVRFPTMDVTYFTQKVSFREILSNDESVSIYQYFHGEPRQLSNLFNTRERNRLKSKRSEDKKRSLPNNRQKENGNKNKHRETVTLRVQSPKKVNTKPLSPLQPPTSPNMSRVVRFRTYDGQWAQNGPPDAISFSCSKPIVLYGIEVYGAARGTETYNMVLFLYDDLKEEVRKNDARITTDTLRRSYEVMFTRPIRVPPRRVFTVMVIMRGSSTNKGVEGSSVHVVDDVTFEFSSSNRSSNGTDVSIGQVPALLFNRTE